MPRAPFTEAEVNALIAAPKVVFSKMEDNRGQPNVHEVRLTYEIRKTADQEERLRLRVFARLENRPNSAVVQAFPGVSLLWYNHRVRCVVWKLKREIVWNKTVIGFVSGWYEHQWTDTDQDKFVIDVNADISRTDFNSVLRTCLRRWNIDDPDGQLNLGVTL
jgi:hypothetical protein